MWVPIGNNIKIMQAEIVALLQRKIQNLKSKKSTSLLMKLTFNEAREVFKILKKIMKGFLFPAKHYYSLILPKQQ